MLRVLQITFHFILSHNTAHKRGQQPKQSPAWMSTTKVSKRFENLIYALFMTNWGLSWKTEV